jgi:hypothetical protein
LAQVWWCLNFGNLLSGSLRISAPSAFELPFNAENAEIRRGPKKTIDLRHYPQISGCCSSTLQLSKISIAMIQREKIEELLKLPAEERRRVVRLLQESLPEEGEAEARSTTGDQPSPAAKWLLSMAGRYSGGPGKRFSGSIPLPNSIL